MRKIIKGRLYDTETAKLVGEDYYGNRSDLEFWSEELYRKITGEFFLYGEGGPMSRYAESSGQNSWGGGERITPLTLEEAQEWGEKYLNASEYEKIFGRIEEDKSQVSTWVPSNVKEEMDRLREERGYTLADIFEAGVKALRE